MSGRKSINKELINQIGGNLKAIRIAKGLSQTDVAKILGVSAQQVQKYENGINEMSFTSVIVLSRHMSVPVRDFCNGSISSDFIHSRDSVMFIAPLISDFLKIECSDTRNTLRKLIKNISKK